MIDGCRTVCANLVRWLWGHAGITGGVMLMILPLFGVIWIAGLPGDKTPEFANFSIRASCRDGIDPVVHIQIPDDQHRSRDLVSGRSDMRLAFQLLDTLGDGSVSACSEVELFSNIEMLSPQIIIGGGDPATSPPLWFYVDPMRGFDAKSVKAVEDPNGWGWRIHLAGDQLDGFAGVLIFELGNILEKKDVSISTFSMSVLLPSLSPSENASVSIGASLAIPADYRLVQNLSIPGPTNVLATNRGPRYEFLLFESLLGNDANLGHWVSLHAVLQDTVWAKWQEYLLFVFSGLFGFAVGFFFESALARRRQG